MFEDRSFDNLSGPLYEPGGGRLFERVIGKRLPNRVSDWAEHRPEDGIVSYGVAAKMNWPSPASGEELPYVNAQLFGILDEENRFKLWAEKSFKERRDGQPPTMDGFLPGLARHFATNFRRWGHSRVPTTWRRCETGSTQPA